jgi:acyl-coenzyme A thioesterase PaaI-like protein
MSSFLDSYTTLRRFPLGRWLFSRGVEWRAPYFASIRPYVADYREGGVDVRMADRRCVHNHIGTVHAIALCNLAELCAALTIDSVMPPPLRWIPQGMQVRYLARARGALRGECLLEAAAVGLGCVPVTVRVFDVAGTQVFEAVIDFHVSARK